MFIILAPDDQCTYHSDEFTNDDDDNDERSLNQKWFSKIPDDDDELSTFT